jgi:hypothetical protein
MSATKWAKFFWSDWETEPGLKQCSLAAQGLWMRLLCVCAKSEPVGYLTIGATPLSMTEIAKAGGTDEATAETLMAELGKWEVYSRDRRGRIYNRRMIRDAKKSKTGREFVNKRWGKQPKELDDNKRKSRAPNRLGANSGDRVPTTQRARTPATHKPEANSHKPEKKEQQQRPSLGPAPEPDVSLPGFLDRRKAAAPLDGKRMMQIGNMALEAAGLDPAKWVGSFACVGQWLNAGADPDLDIIPAIDAVAKRPGYTPPDSLSYFTKPVAAALKQRTAPLPDVPAGRAVNGRAAPSYAYDPARDKPWVKRFMDARQAWIDGGKAGPEPRNYEYEMGHK